MLQALERQLRGGRAFSSCGTSTSSAGCPRLLHDTALSRRRCVLRGVQETSNQGWPISNSLKASSTSPRPSSVVAHAASVEAAHPSSGTQPSSSGSAQQHPSSSDSPSSAPARDVRSVLRGRFQIPAAEVRRILLDHQITKEELLLALIQPASQLAMPFISDFHVGAVGMGGTGAIYVGVNVEFPKAGLNNSIHAEQCLLVNCLHHKETEILVVAVSAAPCGHCRQFYAEVANSDTVQFMFGKAPKPRLLGELLPLRFGPADLAAAAPGAAAPLPGAPPPPPPFPLLLHAQSNPVSFLHPAAVTLARAGDGLFQEAAGEALTEAIQSYSPYTHCPSGVAIITWDGQIYGGAYAESAAFNPSLSPFQAAVVAGITADQRLRQYDQIREVILAELPDADVQHADNIKLLLRAVAPRATLTVLPLQVVPTPLEAAPGAAAAPSAAHTANGTASA